MKPENPGGTTVPNQDKAVYETVAGAGRTVEPQQDKLVTTAEEPIDVSPPMRDEAEEIMDLAPQEDEMTAGMQPKNEDRIAQIVQQSEAEEPNAAMAAVAPRKVRTMIVRPDGTLVPREEPADEPALVEELADAAAQATLAASTPVETPIAAESPAAADAAPVREADAAPGLSPDADPDAGATVTAALGAELAPGAEAGSSAAAEAPDTAAAEAERPAGSPVMPEIAPIAPQRPAEQPIDVVGEVQPARVAALAPAAPPSAPAAPAAAPVAAAPAGAAIWSVQIASQPNEAAARSSYENLAGRYASVLQGHEVNIVKAEIEGKGTYWRVRVPTDSRNEAIRLCESYKEAGGNCFVSR